MVAYKSIMVNEYLLHHNTNLNTCIFLHWQVKYNLNYMYLKSWQFFYIKICFYLETAEVVTVFAKSQLPGN